MPHGSASIEPHQPTRWWLTTAFLSSSREPSEHGPELPHQPDASYKRLGRRRPRSLPFDVANEVDGSIDGMGISRASAMTASRLLHRFHPREISNRRRRVAWTPVAGRSPRALIRPAGILQEQEAATVQPVTWLPTDLRGHDPLGGARRDWLVARRRRAPPRQHAASGSPVVDRSGGAVWRERASPFVRATFVQDGNQLPTELLVLGRRAPAVPPRSSCTGTCS